MTIISSREFRSNQKEYFDRVDEGEQIIVQRGKDKSYIIMPTKKQDYYISEEMKQKLERGLRDEQQGDTVSLKTKEDIAKLLGL